MYKYQVNYTKHFLDGILANRTYHDYLRFADWATADNFKKLCEGGHVFKPFNGNGNYIADDIILTALD